MKALDYYRYKPSDQYGIGDLLRQLLHRSFVFISNLNTILMASFCMLHKQNEGSFERSSWLYIPDKSCLLPFFIFMTSLNFLSQYGLFKDGNSALTFPNSSVSFTNPLGPYVYSFSIFYQRFRLNVNHGLYLCNHPCFERITVQNHHEESNNSSCWGNFRPWELVVPELPR